MFKRIIIILPAIILILNTCNNNPITPDDIKPGRRDYVWTVDTLNVLNNPYYRMWGSSPADIWCVSDANWDKSIAHFDGEQWCSYGISGIIAPRCVFGFSNNDIFISAENGKIWKFDENNWKLFAELKRSEGDWLIFENMWGESSNNFYSFGAYIDNNGLVNNSLIANYKNNNWTILNTDGLTGIVERFFLNKSDNKFYLRTNRLGNGEHYDSTLIYEYTQAKYKQIYGSVWTQGLQADISLINGEVYFALGSEIAIRRNNQFQTVLKINNPNFYQRIWGKSSKDIFLMMVDGLAHYNGTNIEYLFHYPFYTQIFGASLFDNEAILLIYESSTHLNLVYRGKLN